jgi:NCAIR mutase (PurE)-related protein
MDYTITLTETEKKSMEYITHDVDDWITNAAIERARLAKEEILRLNLAHCNANSVALATGEDAQVTQAYTLGVVSKATSDVPSAGD